MSRLSPSIALAAGVGAAIVAGLGTGETAAAAGLQLQAQRPVDMICDTKAVLVATDAANATNGAIRLRLERKADTGPDGTWTPLDHEARHAASLAAMQGKTCSQGCPLSLSDDGDVHLWAPAPKALNALGPNELLLLAVIKGSNLQLKASTFRGQQIEALESGICRIDDAATPDTTSPPKT